MLPRQTSPTSSPGSLLLLDKDTQPTYTNKVIRDCMDFEQKQKQEKEEEYLTRVVVDTCARKFYLYSNIGSDRVVECDCVEQFMGVLELVRKLVEEDIIAYSGPLVSNQK